MSETIIPRRSLVFPPKGGSLPSNPTAVLFHGLTGSPSELEALGEALSAEGYRVLIPCLPGHATTLAELKITPLKAYHDLVTALSVHLTKRGTIVGGLSFGSLLAIWTALELPRKPQAIILLSPPFRLRSRTRERVLGILSKLSENSLNKLGLVKKKKRKFLVERHAYDQHSIAAVARLIKLRTTIVARLKELTMPILILQDPFDHHLHPDGTGKIVELFGSEEVDTLWFPKGEHELTIGPKFSEVLIGVREFLRRARSKNAT